MFLATPLGEFYLQGIHIVIHSLTMLLIGAISYKYFKKDPMKAQMVCFMMLANEEVRELN